MHDPLLLRVTGWSYLYLKSSGAYFDFALKTTCGIKKKQILIYANASGYFCSPFFTSAFFLFKKKKRRSRETGTTQLNTAELLTSDTHWSHSTVPRVMLRATLSTRNCDSDLHKRIMLKISFRQWPEKLFFDIWIKSAGEGMTHCIAFWSWMSVC